MYAEVFFQESRGFPRNKVKGSLAKRSAEGHAKGKTCRDSATANASRRGRLRKQLRKGCLCVLGIESE